MTGWNMPPGCSPCDIPGWNDGFCDICGQLGDACVCPECPFDGSVGDIACFRAGHMEMTEDQIIMRVISEELQKEEARDEHWENFVEPWRDTEEEWRL